MSEINIQPDDLQIVKEILKKVLNQDVKVWVFGSRATGKPKPFSDLDLAFDFGRPISLEELANLKFAFEESTLPFSVDLVDLHAVDTSFKKIILSEMKELFFNPE